MLKAMKITDSIYWVGAIDWNMRTFHGYATGRGTSYSSVVMESRGAMVLVRPAPARMGRVSSSFTVAKQTSTVSFR